MLRAAVYALVGLALARLACALPVEEKTGCVTSADCVDDRICDEGECVPGGCAVTCARACDRVESCEMTCSEDCTIAAGLLPGFAATDCKPQWDLLEEEDCEAVECLLACRHLCSYAATDCRLVVDVPGCIVGCQSIVEDCSMRVLDDCLDLPPEIRCYESGDC